MTEKSFWMTTIPFSFISIFWMDCLSGAQSVVILFEAISYISFFLRRTSAASLQFVRQCFGTSVPHHRSASFYIPRALSIRNHILSLNPIRAALLTEIRDYRVQKFQWLFPENSITFHIYSSVFYTGGSNIL